MVFFAQTGQLLTLFRALLHQLPLRFLHLSTVPRPRVFQFPLPFPAQSRKVLNLRARARVRARVQAKARVTIRASSGWNVMI